MDLSKYPILNLESKSRRIKELPNGVYPNSINWGNGNQPAVIHFSDGKESQGSCIRCHFPTCLFFFEHELDMVYFPDFPLDQNAQVCPTSAISWISDNGSPTIDIESCILCGLCVSRCPVRAIHLTQSGCYIYDEENDHFLNSSQFSNETNNKAIIQSFLEIPESGIYLSENDETLISFYERVINAIRVHDPQFPNMLARNLLIGSNIGAAIRRRGDTNIRMDLILGPPGVEQGTGEVEMGLDILNSPRNILDNIAVLASRYKLSKSNIVPLVVCLSLPNQRSEYWQVLFDINNVVDVKINTLTVGALVLFIWNRKEIFIESNEEFYIDINDSSLRNKAEQFLGREIGVSINVYPGFLESLK